jgi:hypothetical protein
MKLVTSMYLHIFYTRAPENLQIKLVDCIIYHITTKNGCVKQSCFHLYGHLLYGFAYCVEL